jgi:DNA ligase 1
MTTNRIFPLNGTIEYEGDKSYIHFEGSTGIMLADHLYKDGKMVALSNTMIRKYLSPPVGWILSEKYDGLRCIWTGNELIARPSKRDGQLKAKVFQYVPQQFIQQLPIGFSLDGELWLGRGRFQEIVGLSNLKPNKKVTTDELDEIWKEVQYMVFDIPHLSDRPYVERRNQLEALINDGFPSIRLSVVTTVLHHDHLIELYTSYVEKGAEGIILREPTSKYETKRSKLLLKMKISDDDEAQVIEYIMGTGKYVGMLGAIKCIFNGKYVQIGTGFTDIMRTEYAQPDSKYFIPLGSMVNFSYMELTKDGIPRHPVFRGVRDDL